MSSEKLNLAISAIKTGDKTTGANLLNELLKDEPQNESAWIWLATCLDDKDLKVNCLKKVLSINPNNQIVIKALYKLEQHSLPTLEEIVPGQTAKSPLSSVEPISYEDKLKSTVRLLDIDKTSPPIGTTSKDYIKKNRHSVILALIGILLFVSGSALIVSLILPRLKSEPSSGVIEETSISNASVKTINEYEKSNFCLLYKCIDEGDMNNGMKTVHMYTVQSYPNEYSDILIELTTEGESIITYGLTLDALIPIRPHLDNDDKQFVYDFLNFISGIETEENIKTYLANNFENGISQICLANAIDFGGKELRVGKIREPTLAVGLDCPGDKQSLFTPTTVNSESCQKETFSYFSYFMPLMKEFQDTVNQMYGKQNYEVISDIEKLKTIRQNIVNLTPPLCSRESVDLFVKGVDHVINAFSLVITGKSSIAQSEAQQGATDINNGLNQLSILAFGKSIDELPSQITTSPSLDATSFITIIPETTLPKATNIPQQSTPIPLPIVLTGSGTSIKSVEKWDGPALIHIIGKTEGFHSFMVKNDNGLFLVLGEGAYDGVKLLDAFPETNTKYFEVEAVGDWSIEIYPLYSEFMNERILIPPYTYNGSEDDVLFLRDGKYQIKVNGNSESRNFAIWTHGDFGNSYLLEQDLIVNVTDPYQGTIDLPEWVRILEIEAVGPWTVEINNR